MKNIIKKYQDKYPKSIISKYQDNSIKIIWPFGSFVIIEIDKEGNEELKLTYDKGLINIGLENILNHFNAQNEQTDITEQFRKADGTMPTVDEFNKPKIGGDIKIN